MQAEIITIGDEILIGQIVDTNSAFIAKELNKIGISVYQITSVQDERQHILKALKAAGDHADIVICTGGLGPTKDDITKHTFCEFFNDTLVRNEAVLAHVEYLFEKYIKSTTISDVNRQQAMVPSRAEVLKNEYGTAPGMWIKGEHAVYVSLPGVPFEMKNLIKNQVVPKIMDTFERPHILHRTLVTYGRGESAIAEDIADWEANLPDTIKLAYLPNLGKVRLRLSAKGTDKALMEKTMEAQLQQLYPLIKDILYGEEDEETLEAVVGKLFVKKKRTLATAESCTGGKIAQQLTAIPGASAYFKGSVVSYATETKVTVLNVPERIIADHSVVSKEVAMAMAGNVRELLGSDYAIATTGNAGPSKGDSEAPVGTVYIAIATPDGIYAEHFMMGNHRDRVVQKTVHKALEMMQKEISKI
ncbi:competence/damage-inducible protein A [Maribacter sp. 2-571]|uniref:competence/damage-inducible protein A n=1 Tax=Maribacter sp. 2-571 TaxID=3417569 RepID=UPI003D336FB3